MNIATQRKLDRMFGAFACRVLSVVDRILPKRKPPAEPRAILIILLSEMGSWVLSAPMFRYLKAKYPQARIHAITFKQNRVILDILEYIPAENIITLDPSAAGSFVATFFSAWRRMRRAKLDVVIDCELFHRISAITAWCSGAPVRVGFQPHTQEGLYRGSFFNRPVLYNPYRHISRQFLTLASAIEESTCPISKRLTDADDLTPPQVTLKPGETDAIEARLLERFPSIFDRDIVLMYPSGGALPIRAWPEKSYAELTHRLVERGCHVALIGMPEDKPLAETIIAQNDRERCFDLTGFTQSVRELVVLFHLASLLVTNDGGPGQFAAATPLKTIILFGPETSALYGPTGRNTVCIQKPLACSPCLTAYNHRNTPCDGDNVCLKSITVDEVMERAEMLINGTAAR